MRAVHREFLRQRYFYLVMLLLFLLMGLTLRNEQRGADGREYLRWTHSFVVDRDIHLLNNVLVLGGSYSLTPTGYVFERVNVGAPLLWAPFYAAAAFFVPASERASYPADGLIPTLWLNFSSWLYPVLGMLLTIGALRPMFSGRILAAAVIAVVLGTPVLFYMITFPMSSHPATIFLAALLLFVWLRAGSPGKKGRTAYLRYLALGVVSGWLMVVASYNVIFFILPALDLLRELAGSANRAAVLKKGLAAGLGGLIGFAPQMIVWGFLFGSPFYSPYSGQLLWSEPYLLETLFSSFHGLFFYAPVLLLAAAGLWLWRSRSGWLALSVGLAWLALAYIVSINVAWWAGASFGNRYFLSLTPFYVFGLAAFMDRAGKWAVVPAALCVLWTVGLYLQFLDGVWFTSDSIVYSMADLARGQAAALRNAAAILPRLFDDRPWLLAPPSLLPVFGLALILAGRIVYGRAIMSRASKAAYSLYLIPVAGVLVVIWIGWAGLRGEQARASLVEQGFYDSPHPVIRREIKELAGRAGLVTRAMYHRQTGRPDKAAADLKRASELWQQESAAAPQRIYLGQKNEVEPGLPPALHLDYPGQVRLIGYRINEAGSDRVAGELFWEKLSDDDAREVIRPVIRVFDAAGMLAGSATLDFPFPAHYVPAGGVFKDSFSVQLTAPPDTWAWLGVSLQEFLSLPVNGRGEKQSDIIASINLQAFPLAPFTVGEEVEDLVGKPVLLQPNGYRVDAVPLQVVWQAAKQVPEARLEVSLLDGREEPVSQAGYPIRVAKAGITNGTYCLAIPETGPAGRYRLTARLQPPEAGRFFIPDQGLLGAISMPLSLPAPGAEQAATICNLLEPGFARRYEPTFPQHRLDAPVTEAIGLAGYDLFIVPQPTSLLAKIILHWYAEANVSADYLVSLQLLDSTGQALISSSGVPLQGARPTSTWLKGEWLVDEHLVEAPMLPPGSYKLRLSLLNQQTGLAVGNSAGLDLQTLQIP